MKKLPVLFLITIVFLGACKLNPDEKFNGICPAVFKSITLATQNSSGKPIAVLNMEAKNTRTGKIYANIKQETLSFNGEIRYTVASDNNKNDFTAQGDMVLVTATTSTGNTITCELKIANGGCNITKLTGPDVLTVE